MMDCHHVEVFQLAGMAIEERSKVMKRAWMVMRRIGSCHVIFLQFFGISILLTFPWN